MVLAECVAVVDAEGGFEPVAVLAHQPIGILDVLDREVREDRSRCDQQREHAKGDR